MTELAMRPAAPPVAFRVIWALLLVLFTLTGTYLSTYTSIAINILALLLLPALFLHPLRARLRNEPLLLFLAVPILFALAFSLSAKQPSDTAFAANFLPLALALPVYVLARTLASDRTRLVFSSLCLAGLVIATLLGVHDKLQTSYAQVEGYLTGANIYARMAVLLGFTSAIGALTVQSPTRFVFLIGPALSAACVLMSGSRGAFLTLPPLALILFLALVSGEKGPARKIILIATPLLTLGGVALAALLFANSRVQTAFTDAIAVLTGSKIADVSITLRLDFYQAGWALFRQSPMFGIGWFRPDEVLALIKLQNPATEATYFFAFHNDLLQFAVSAGMLGILAYVLVYAAPVLSLWRTPKDRFALTRIYGVTILLSLYLISGLTDIVLGYDMPTTAYAFMCALVLGLFRERGEIAS